MPAQPGRPAEITATVPDSELARLIARADDSAFETLMRRHNGRLFRLARSIVKDDADAEDALQDAYLDAYRHIATFRGESQLGTWLGRIVVNHALMRLRRQKRDRVIVPFAGTPAASPEDADTDFPDRRGEWPSTATLRAEVRRLLERRIDELPVNFRTVFVLRDVEEMTVEETAAYLGIPPATVRTRLFRARALLREALARDVDLATGEVFGFAGARCDRIVARVLDRVAILRRGNTQDG